MRSKRRNCFTMTDDQWEAYQIAYDNFPQNPDELFSEFQEMAEERYDGHYTILKFTTGFKVAFGTPELYGPFGRFQVQLLPNFLTLIQAIEFAVMWNVSFENIFKEAEKLA